jgi:diaminohydroxyphosphoribosylaminopyrimidine deaminase / 5-amino-6-(5-phosphoribosylamino)uracil reductase
MIDLVTCRSRESTPTQSAQTDDIAWMNRALDLAHQAVGRVSPNPAVGAVIVQNGQIVGQGHTEPPGQRHAEIVALDLAGDHARGATMYVTLEPCAHFGRTPPCLNAILDAGISRVVIAVPDPNPLVNGQSIAALRDAGVDVDLGIGASEAIRINAGFFRRLQTGRPEIHVKYAMSLDGKIATHTGHARWITGPEAREQAHLIRDRSDAILVGIGTVLADDPMLTTRIDDVLAGSGGPSHPLRVVVDSHARTPVTAAMLRPETPGCTVIAVSELAPPERIRALSDVGAEILLLPEIDRRVDLDPLMTALGERGINSLMVEGGAQIIGSLAESGLIDRVTAFIAPVLLGGYGAPSPIGGTGVAQADHGSRLIDPVIEQIGNDIRVSGYLTDRYPDERLLACSPAS